jgi:serine-type D-Ala-D-Ala carboxypeptidase (penicillin-binding protein 5/6)
MFTTNSLLVATSLLVSPVSAAVPTYNSAAPIAYMVDLSSGAVLFEKDSNRRIPPASMAKMMTAYVAFDLISKRKLKVDQTFTVRPKTWEKWNNVGSTMFLAPNQKVKVSDLLHGLITVSGNDAAVVLAESIAGTEANFVDQMNATAKRLGMKSTEFGTANGWPDEGRTLTTAHDLALLGVRTIHDYPALYHQYYGSPEFRWSSVTQPNRNPILGKIAGADGIKTGHTDQAGYCFTGTAEQNGRRIVIVVAGLNSFNARMTESIRFMQWGFNAWRTHPLYNAHSIVAKIPVQMGRDNSVAVVAPRNLALSLPAQGTTRYTLLVRYVGPIKAPFNKGAEIAQLVAIFPDGQRQISPLVAQHSVSRAGFFGRAWNGLMGLFSR